MIVKRPDNLFHKATIPTGLPKAKFVITERDWRDTLVSIFGTRLHLQHGYATNAVAIAEHAVYAMKLPTFGTKITLKVFIVSVIRL